VKKISLFVAAIVTSLTLFCASEIVRVVVPSIAAEDTTEKPSFAATVSTNGNCNVSRQNNSVTCVVDPSQGTTPTTGGSQSSDAEEERRKKILGQLDIEYDNLDGGCPSLVLTPAPADWTNKRLKELGEAWQVPDNGVGHMNYSYNTIISPCNRIDMHNVGNANADHNFMVGPSNEITVHDAGTANVQQNYMGAGAHTTSGQGPAPASTAGNH
jgi:hypothetical protein